MSAPRIRGPMNRTALALALLMILPLAPATAVDPGPEVTASEPFAPNVRITYGTTPYAQQVEPMLAVDSLGRLFLGWKEALTDSGGGQRVSFSRSLDGGVTWSAAAPAVDLGYLIEARICLGAYLWDVYYSTINTSYTIKDPPTCSGESYAQLRVFNKLGYSTAAKIPWP